MRRAAIAHSPMPALLAGWIAASIALAALSGCAGSGSATVPHAATATSAATAIARPATTPPPTVAGTYGPPPSNCQVSPPPRTMTVTNFGGGFSGTTTFAGAAPARQLGFGSDGVMHASGQPYPSSKIMWVVGPDFNQPVTLSGRELRTGSPLWFDIYPSNRTGGSDYYTTSAVLDPEAPNRGDAFNSSGHWNIWGIGIIVLAAGCYQLDVSSSAGNWHTAFAAGGR